MAYKETRHFNEDLRYFWNVSWSVGLGCPNYKPDVALVQALLRKAYDTSFIASLKVDGICGSQTRKAIRKFQFDYSGFSVGAGYEPLECDGVVTRADNFGFDAGGESYTAYTIVALNYTLLKNKPTVWKNIPYDPSVPVYVRMQLLQGHA